MTTQSDWFEKDYYKVLGVPDSATDREIQVAYRRLARRFHPDANVDDAVAAEHFKEISAAFHVLGNAERRREYDELRRVALTVIGRGASNGTRSVFGVGVPGFRFEDLAGADAGRRFPERLRGAAAVPTALRGQDVDTGLSLTFEQAVFGGVAEIVYTAPEPCATCSGAGLQPGTAPLTCAGCHGRGRLVETQGFFAISRPCPRCGGRGWTVERLCDRCQGSGTEQRQRQLKLRVPANVQDGQVIRLRGRGEAGYAGGAPGDLLVRVRVTPHRLFCRDGGDLTITVPITYPEAVLGAEIKVPALGHGAPLSVKIPPGTPSGRVFRVPGHGVPRRSAGRGDLRVTVEVAVPSRLEEPERAAVEALAATMRSNPRATLGV